MHKVFCSAVTTLALGLILGSVLGLGCAAQVSITSNRYDSNRSATNLAETTLTASNVNSSTFGKLWSYAVEGPIFAQPLYVPGVTTARKTHNVLYVATMHDLLYAFDADGAGSPLWTRNLTDGATPADASAYAPVLVPGGADNYLGVLSTPVIDIPTSTMYLVAATSEGGANIYRLHAVDIRTGQDTQAPVVITATVGGESMDPVYNIQRAGLVLAGGKVLIAFSGNPYDSTPYHGWVVSYDMNTLIQEGAFTTTQGVGLGASIWQSGGAPPVDGAGNAYYLTGNGFGASYDGITNFAQSLLQMSSSGTPLSDWQPAGSFTPSNWLFLDNYDLDLSCNGPMLIPGTSLIAFGSKSANIYVADTNHLDGEQPAGGQPVQYFHVGPVSLQSPAAGYAGIAIGSAPALAAFNGELYAAFQANDSTPSLSVTSSEDGLHFSTPAAEYPAIVMGSAPALAVFNKRLYVAFQADDASHSLYLTSTPDGVNFTSPAVEYPDIPMGSAPAMAVFNKRLYLAFQADDVSRSLMITSSADGVNFTTPAVAYPGIPIGSAPAMTVFDGKLIVAFQANDSSHELMITRSADGVNFSTPAIAYPGIQIGSAPAIAVFQRILYISFQANDPSQILYVTSSTDGHDFTSPAVGYPGIVIGSAPGMAGFDNRLLAAFQAPDSSHALNVASSSESGSVQVSSDGNRIIGLAFRERTANGPSLLYAWPGFGNLTSVPFNGTSFDTSEILYGTVSANGEPSVALSISANGNAPGTAVVWATKTTQGRSVAVPGRLYAFDGDTLQQLWNSGLNPADHIGGLGKFVIPVVVNGHVYIASSTNSVSVFGLK